MHRSDWAVGSLVIGHLKDIMGHAVSVAGHVISITGHVVSVTGWRCQLWGGIGIDDDDD